MSGLRSAALPAALTWLRIALGPVVLLLAIHWPRHPAFALCLTLAFLSDVFDGIIARRLGVATPALRRLDSAADTAFYACALGAVWVLHAQVIRDNLALGAALAVLEVARYALDLAKFGREASYHMWSSKAWGIALFAGFVSVLVLDRGGLPATLAIAVGIVADLEGLLISLVLPSWQSDVPSIVHALRLRHALRPGRSGV